MCSFSIVPFRPYFEYVLSRDESLAGVEGDGDDLAALHLFDVDLRLCDVVMDFLLARCEEVGEDDMEAISADGLLLFPQKNDVFVELYNLVAIFLIVEADAI